MIKKSLTKLSILVLIICGCFTVQGQAYFDNVSTLAGCASGAYLDGPGATAQFNQPTGVAVDKAGNVFVADELNHRIRKITPAGNVSTFAGDGSSGTADGVGVLAKFNVPTAITIDNLNNLYVADQNSGRIRKITPTAIVTTLATLNAPTGLTVNKSTGELYIAALGTNQIVKISAGGTVSVFAGSGVAGFINGTSAAAQFNQPAGVILDSIGNVYVSDNGNNCIRKITQAGIVSTFAGTGAQGLVNGLAASSQFYNPIGLVFDKIGNLFISDGGNGCIRKIDPSGMVSTFAGTGISGFADGIVSSAKFYGPYNIAIDSAGSYYIGDRGNQRIRKISKSFLTILTQTNVACSGATSGAASITVNGGIGPYTYSWSPTGGTSSSATGLIAGIYKCVVTDASSITSTQTLNITQPSSLTVLPYVTNVICNSGNTGSVSVNTSGGVPPYTYLWSSGATSSVISNLSAGALTVTSTDAVGCSKTITVTVTQPTPTITVSASSNTISIGQISNLTVAISGGASPYTYTWTPIVNTTTFAVSPTSSTTYTVKIKDANACISSGTINISILTNTNISSSNYVYVNSIAGTGSPAFADGLGNGAAFNYPNSSVIDHNGNLYITDVSNHRIRKVTPAGVVTTFAGSGIAGYLDATGTAAQFNSPMSIAIDVSGNLYVTDMQNQRIRKITSAGVVSTYAGNGTSGLVNGFSSTAEFSNPYGLVVDPIGNIYVADRNNSCIRKISTTGIVSTVAGNGYPGFTNGTGTSGTFNYPTDIAMSSSGDIYVADEGNNSLRKLTPSGVVTTIAGNGVAGYADGVGIASQFNDIFGITIDKYDNIFVTEFIGNHIRKVSLLGVTSTITHNGTFGYINGIDTLAELSGPTDLSIDTLGNIYVVDKMNHCIRKLSAALSSTVNVLAKDCFPNSTGAVSVSVSGGYPPYSYSWSQSLGNSSTLNGVSTGTYMCTITDANSLMNLAVVNVGIDTICQHVWPGDANSDGLADNLDILELGLHFAQIGSSRTVTSNIWQSYFSYNWNGFITNGENLNHSDCNGDGIINDDDTLAIYNNYGLTHAFKPEQTTTNPVLTIVPDQSSVVKGTWGTASINLGDATTLISNINGIACTISYDNTLFETDSIWIEYPTSFINATNQNLKFRKRDFSNGKLYTATTHTINGNANGYGKIAVLHYKIKSTLATDNVLNLSIGQANQSNASGLITPLTAGSATLMALGTSITTNLNALTNGNYISLHPNPTNGALIVNSTTELQKIDLMAITGQLLMSEVPSSTSHVLHLDHLANGVYFVNLYQNNRIVKREKIILNK